MRFALDTEQMRAAEQAAVASGAVSIAELMDRAGRALADETARRVPGGSVVVVCGPGNNGGDGWVAARVLSERGRDVSVIALKGPESLTGAAAEAARTAIDAGVAWRDASAVAEDDVLYSSAALIIDALFGFGLRGAVEDPYARWIARINDAHAITVSADVPSGVDSDTGEVTGAAVTADATVTFSALKVGLLTGAGAAHAGDVIVADLGIEGFVAEVQGVLSLPEASDVRTIVPWPSRTDHKGSRGRIALVVGSETYPGAAVLAAGGALRMGAGYVSVAATRSVCQAVLAAWPSVICRSVAGGADGAIAQPGEVLAAVSDSDAVIVGPGITRSDGARDVVRALLDSYGLPLLLDADALNVLAGDVIGLRGRQSSTVITPHPGEAARLLGITIDAVERDRVGAARSLSGPSLVCVLKGSETIIAGPSRTALVRTGGPELARAGTGDVLAGMIGTLLAQGCSLYDAAVAGVYLHGRAGALGAERYTATSHIASDLFGFIPDAVRELAGG